MPIFVAILAFFSAAVLFSYAMYKKNVDA